MGVRYCTVDTLHGMSTAHILQVRVQGMAGMMGRVKGDGQGEEKMYSR